MLASFILLCETWKEMGSAHNEKDTFASLLLCVRRENKGSSCLK